MPFLYSLQQILLWQISIFYLSCNRHNPLPIHGIQIYIRSFLLIYCCGVQSQSLAGNQHLGQHQWWQCWNHRLLIKDEGSQCNVSHWEEECWTTLNLKINSEICNSEFPVPKQLILVQSTLSMFSPSQVHACDTKSSSIDLQYHNHYSNI